MSDYQKRTRDIAIILGVSCLVLYMFRLWPLVLAVILVGGVVLLKRVLFPQKEIQEKQEEPMQQPVIPNVYDDQSVWDKKYEFAVEKISCLVAKEYPNAKWIWESANWKEFFQKVSHNYRLKIACGIGRFIRVIKAVHIAFKAACSKNVLRFEHNEFYLDFIIL